MSFLSSQHLFYCKSEHDNTNAKPDHEKGLIENYVLFYYNRLDRIPGFAGILRIKI